MLTHMMVSTGALALLLSFHALAAALPMYDLLDRIKIERYTAMIEASDYLWSQINTECYFDILEGSVQNEKDCHRQE